MASVAIIKKLDYDFINGQGGKSIIGLASTARGTINSDGTRLLAPSERIIDNTANLEAVISTAFDSDITEFEAINGQAHVILAPGYLRKMFEMSKNPVYITGTRKIQPDVIVSAYKVEHAGVSYSEASHMFSNRFNNNVVGIIALPNSLSTSVDGSNFGIDIRTDNGYVGFTRNQYRFLAETFVDLVVEQPKKVVLLRDLSNT